MLQSAVHDTAPVAHGLQLHRTVATAPRTAYYTGSRPPDATKTLPLPPAPIFPIPTPLVTQIALPSPLIPGVQRDKNCTECRSVPICFGAAAKTPDPALLK